MPVIHYDAVVVGAGQGGGPLASAFAEAGKRTALIEREHVGGTCVNEGCTPTKTMIASARVAHLARRAGGYGVRTGAVRVDMGAVLIPVSIVSGTLAARQRYCLFHIV